MNTNLPSFKNIEVPSKKVLARLGYAHGITSVDDGIREMILDEMELAKKLIVPKQVAASSVLKLMPPAAVSLNELSINSRDLFKLFSNCVTVFGFAVTIGTHLEEKRDAYLKDKETTRALILDAVGSESVDYLAELTNQQITGDSARDGLKTTRRFSPGYGDWPVSGQQELLKWLGADSIGISLTPAFQMIPEKSVSAILGVYK
jgi:hypothetical protein